MTFWELSPIPTMLNTSKPKCLNFKLPSKPTVDNKLPPTHRGPQIHEELEN